MTNGDHNGQDYKRDKFVELYDVYLITIFKPPSAESKQDMLNRINILIEGTSNG